MRRSREETETYAAHLEAREREEPLMSLTDTHHAVAWAWQQTGLPSRGTKLVLLALAFDADDEWTTLVDPKRLCQHTAMSRPTVRRHLDWLVANGYIRPAEFRPPGKRRWDHFYLRPVEHHAR